MSAPKQLLISIFIVLLSAFSVSAQCHSSIKVKESTLNRANGKGAIVLEVNAQGSFQGQVVRFEGIKEIVVREFSGSSNETFTIENLDPKYVYRAKVIFDAETGILCRSKLIDDIELGDAK